MASMLDSLSGPEAKNLVKQLQSPFSSLPHLPKGLISFIVSINPWLAGLMGIMSLIGGISMITGSGSSWGMMAWSHVIGVNRVYFLVTGVAQLIAGLLLVLAFKPLQGKKLEGWMFLFWSAIVNLAASLIGIVYGLSGIVGFIISTFLSLYILFEIKPKYK